jgi:RHS repeat-associated protein
MGDHLGSTSLVVNTSGAQVARRSYLPFGAQWAASGSLPTDFGFTGQREADEIGLYYYVARWYDVEIGHFAQADTIVPGAGNPAAYNRYGYVDYNPINYSDPTGHKKRPTKANGYNKYDVTEFLALDLVATANSQENQDLEALWKASENTANLYPHIGYVVSSQVAAVFGVNARFGSGKVKDIKLEMKRRIGEAVTLCSTESCAWVDYSTPGNIVFGYSMAQIGIDALIYETAGGFLEMWDTRGGLRDDYDFAWWLEGSMGDNPDDYAAVQFGIYLFMTYGTDLTYADLQEALVYWLNRFQPPPDDFDEPFLARPGDNDYGAGYFDYIEE